MLALQLKSGDYLTIGENIAVQVFQQPGSSFRVEVKAPREIPILRGSVRERTGADRPDGLLDHRPTQPSRRIRNARNMEQFAQRKEEQAAAVQAMRDVLDLMESSGEFTKELSLLRTHLERVAAAGGR